MKVDKNKLTIPIYLNTKIVFDMLATIEDGFSEVRNIQTSESKRKEDGIEANIGTSNLFAFLNVGINGNKKSSNSKDEIISEERTHTTVSLFQKLRTQLEEEELIKKDIDAIEVGDFLEIQGTLRANPLIEMLSSLKEMAVLAELFSENKSNKSKGQKLMENKKFEAQIDGLIKGLQSDGRKDIICESSKTKIILATDENYFLNNNMSEITDCDYKILGKIIKICKNDEEISLLRNTVFSKLKFDRMKDFQDLFNDPALSPFAENENIVTVIKAPVIMLIPIAIYV